MGEDQLTNGGDIARLRISTINANSASIKRALATHHCHLQVPIQIFVGNSYVRQLFRISVTTIRHVSNCNISVASRDEKFAADF